MSYAAPYKRLVKTDLKNRFSAVNDASQRIRFLASENNFLYASPRYFVENESVYGEKGEA